jgi:hypothetical protein
MSAVVVFPPSKDSVKLPPTTEDPGIRTEVKLKSSNPLTISKSILITVNSGNAVGLGQRNVIAHLNPDGPETCMDR